MERVVWLIAVVGLAVVTLVQRSRCGNAVLHEDADLVFEAVSFDALESNGTEVFGSSSLVHNIVRRATRRTRRSANNKDVQRYSTEERNILVDLHNKYRAGRRASDMMYMYWDEGLEATAQRWAENCAFKHSNNRDNIKGELDTFRVVGENLYASTGTYDARTVVEAWYNEVADYNYNRIACTPGKMCGHYTQIVWASSYALGCGVAYCPVLTDVSFGRGFHVVCHYGPAGNYVGQRPYRKGQPVCSQCGRDAKLCIDDMCARYPVVGVGGTSTSPVSPRGDKPTSGQQAANATGLPLLLLLVVSSSRLQTFLQQLF